MSSTSSSSASVPSTVSSDHAVPFTMRQGLETTIVKTTVGLILGGLAGVVLARTGASGARKGLAGLGAGIGLGSGWTRTSMNLEELLASTSSDK